MAAIWKLPVIFVCENNQYGMSTSTERSTAVKRISERAAAYAMPGVTVDGNDFSAVAEAMHEAIARARAGEGPSLVESLTYRWRGHSKSDRNRYRTKDEIDELDRPRPDRALPHRTDRPWRRSPRRRPTTLLKEAEADVADGIEFAKASPAPSTSEVTRYVYGSDAMTAQDQSLATREMSYAEAIRDAMAIAMERDKRVILMGEDIGVYGGAFQVTGDLIDRFGADRVMDTPISELGGAGVAVGAALTGLRPIFEFQFSDFATLAMEQIVNQAAKLRYMLGGEASVPLVLRMPSGSGTGAAAQHSQSLEAWFGHVPGLKVVQPATPADAKGLLLAALEDPDPVIVFEHKILYKMKGQVPEGYYTMPIGKAEIRREGTDLTIVASAIMVHRALDAAETLAAEGISAEVIDLRSIRPLDRETIIASVCKTGKLLCVYEGVRTLGVGAEISALVAESEAFDYLDAPIQRLGGAEAPDPLQPRSREGGRSAGRPTSRPRPAGWRAGRSDMPVEVIMPKVDMDMASGKLAAWHVAEGEMVTKGAPLFDIETDKAAMEVESPATGRLHHVVAAPGQTVDVGAPVAWIYAEGEAVGADPSAPSRPPSKPLLRHPRPPPEPAAATSERPAANDGVRATPIARRLARDAGLDLGSVTGSGPHGRIQREDVEKLLGAPQRPAEARAPAPEPRAVRAALRRPPGRTRPATSSSRPARGPARRSCSFTASRPTRPAGCRSSANCRTTCR